AAAITASDVLVQALKWLGIALLLYLGFVYARSAISARRSGHSGLEHEVGDSSGRSGFVEGALIAILNPKILAWMLAIYSPFIDSDFDVPVLLGIASIGMIIDGTWYMSVATFLTSGNRSEKLQRAASKIDGVMAVLMLGFATFLVIDLIEI
nr:LysE family transporter [Chloroflexota bacterium]